jgi:hypothetical protein
VDFNELQFICELGAGVGTILHVSFAECLKMFGRVWKGSWRAMDVAGNCKKVMLAQKLFSQGTAEH